MIVQFVCRGNTFRSRMAEAYLNSKQIKNIKAISSGIDSYKNIDGPITWYAERIIRENGLVPFMSFKWVQASKNDLEKSDVVIFMNQDIFDFVKNELKASLKNYEVWKIPDIYLPEKETIEEDVKNIKISEEIFTQIRHEVDGLIKRLK